MELTRQSPRALARTVAVLAAASAALLVLAFPASAHAEPETPPALTAERPTITSPADGSFLGSGSAVLTGTKAAGSTVQILAGSSRTSVCTVRSADTTFSCSVSRLPSGPRIPLTAVQLIDGDDNLESEPVYVDVLAPPTIAGTPVLTNGLVQGVGYPNARITLSVGGGSTWSFPAGPEGAWAYVLPRTIGSGSYTLTATQSTPFSHGSQSASSPGVSITLDVDPPEPPTLTSPRPDSSVSPTGVRYSGAGENGATVNVFALTASGSDVALCSATVSADAWSCTGAALPAGTATVTSYQTDAAGNAGTGSAPLSLTVSQPSTARPTPSPSATERDDPTVAPVVPTVPPSATPTPSPSESVVPVPPAEPPAAEPPSAGTWEAATPFTTAVPPALGTADLSWLRALLLAAVAVLLLLVPARMLATTVRGRGARGLPVALTGRNRVPTHDDPAPLVTAPGERVTAAVLVAVAGGMVLFANPVQGELEFLRVLLASVVAVSLVNLVATVVPARLAARLPSGDATVALSPRFLLTVAGVAVLSRVFSLEPALLFGIVFTVTAVSGTRSARGMVAGIRIAAVFALGLLAWLASTLLGTPTGFLDSLLTETANVAAMAGIGSAAILLVPLGRLDGRALLLWSRPAWFGAAFVVLTVLFALLAPVVDVWQTSGDVLLALVVVLTFGALGLSLWIWRRLVQPAMTSD
ncbi:hypothetical protein [Mycetocola sp. 2940]|uniref:hypothetical protein n=1 Tax=Mycetocola sp. 2940 TaxID=3156452 RepID=UPI0033912B69